MRKKYDVASETDNCVSQPDCSDGLDRTRADSGASFLVKPLERQQREATRRYGLLLTNLRRGFHISSISEKKFMRQAEIIRLCMYE